MLIQFKVCRSVQMMSNRWFSFVFNHFLFLHPYKSDYSINLLSFQHFKKDAEYPTSVILVYRNPIILSNRSYMNCNRFLYQTGKDYSYSKPITESKFNLNSWSYNTSPSQTVGSVNSWRRDARICHPSIRRSAQSYTKNVKSLRLLFPKWNESLTLKRKENPRTKINIIF